MRRAFALGAIAVLTGCASVGEGPSASSVAAPSAFAYASRVESRAPLATLLPNEDPAFQTLLTAVESQTPDLQVALARVDAARAALRAAGAARAPNIGVEGSANYARTSENAVTNLPPGLAIDTTNSNFSSGINASWDLDLFGRLRASQRAAGLRLDAADADARAVRLALVTDIARAVVDYRIAQGKLRIVEDDLADAASLVKLTDTRARAGIAPGLDLVRAQSLEAAARSQRGPAEAELAAALGRLVTLTARDGASVAAAFESPASDDLAGLPAVGLPSALLRQRPRHRCCRISAWCSERRNCCSRRCAVSADQYQRRAWTCSIGIGRPIQRRLADGVARRFGCCAIARFRPGRGTNRRAPSRCERGFCLVPARVVYRNW